MRRVCAWIVSGVTITGAIWLYTYRVPVVVEYVYPTGQQFHPAQRSTEQPWWAVPTTVLLVVIGAALIVSLVPARRRQVRGFVDRLGAPTPQRQAKPIGRRILRSLVISVVVATSLTVQLATECRSLARRFAEYFWAPTHRRV